MHNTAVGRSAGQELERERARAVQRVRASGRRRQSRPQGGRARSDRPLGARGRATSRPPTTGRRSRRWPSESSGARSRRRRGRCRTRPRRPPRRRAARRRSSRSGSPPRWRPSRRSRVPRHDGEPVDAPVDEPAGQLELAAGRPVGVGDERPGRPRRSSRWTARDEFLVPEVGQAADEQADDGGLAARPAPGRWGPTS